MRKVIVACVISATIATVFGPVVVAAVSALLQSREEVYPSMGGSGKLLDAISAQEPDFRLNLSIYLDDSNIAECGYGFNALFGRNREEDELSGFNLIERSESNDWRRMLRDRQADHLEGTLSPFKMHFLANCINGTLFSNVCVAGAKAHLAPPISPDHEWARSSRRNTKLMRCRYLDGVAARAGLPLSKGPVAATIR
ncbi:hypothetical protein [Sphingomonas sp.]